jgi:hypothetical protein
MSWWSARSHEAQVLWREIANKPYFERQLRWKMRARNLLENYP